VSLRRLKQPSSKFQIALIALIPLFCATGARADTFDITITNATFSATCIGGTGTCSEVVNGSFVLDYGGSVASDVASDVSIQLTGTLAASLDGLYPAPYCVSPLCVVNGYTYDSGVLPSFDPIEFSPDFPTLNAPTPEALAGGADGSELYVPTLCGGDQAACNSTGSFPTGADFNLTSGTYTSVDVSPSAPEPGSVILLITGVGTLGFLSRRRLVAGRPPSQTGSVAN
jgi:hypothetical protein